MTLTSYGYRGGRNPYKDIKYIRKIYCDTAILGTSWVSRILSLIKYDSDEQKVDATRIDDVIPQLENAKHEVMKLSSPRMMSTHLSYSHIPKCFKKGKAKVVLIDLISIINVLHISQVQCGFNCVI